MTSLAVPANAEQAERRRTIGDLSWLALLEHVAMVALLIFWAVPFTRATGGRGVHTELVFALLIIPLLVTMQVWRAPSRSVVTASLVALVAILVCVFSPTGWWGTDVAAGYILSAAAFVIARRYVRDADRRKLVATAICLAGMYEFSQSFIAWWGSRNPATEMSGTFYWHNPYAAFLLPGAVIGLALVAERRSPWNLVGWVSSPLCAAGIVFSSSRATMVVLVVAWLIVLAASLRSRTTILRVGGAVVVSATVVMILPGPPFFPHYSSPFAGTSVRASSGETLSQNGVYRTEFWRGAIEVAEHRPLVGSGYRALATASAFYTPSGWARSPQAHNGYLQALSDGGLLLGVPFLSAVAVIAFWALRRFWVLLTRRGRGADGLLVGVIAVALLGALAHSAVDFDWSHPSIMVEAALMAACVAPEGLLHGPSSRLRRTIPALSLSTLIAVLGVSCVALHQWQIDQPNWSRPAAALLADAGAPFGDYRPAMAVLQEASEGRISLTTSQARDALRLTAAEAGVDMHLSLLRDAVGAQFGVMPDAVALATAELRHVDGSIAPYVLDLATVYAAAGDYNQTRMLLTKDLKQQVLGGAASPNLNAELGLWARQLGPGAGYACALRRVRGIVGPGFTDNLPTPTAACPAALGQGSP